MGNAQSALTTDKQQYKLTKPKTFTGSSNLLCTSASPPGSSNSLDSPVKVHDGWGVEVEARGLPYSQHNGNIREASYEGCKSMTSCLEAPKERLSRTCSMVSQMASAMASTTLVNGSVGGSRLSLVTERPAFSVESSSQMLEEIRAKASKDELAAQFHCNTPRTVEQPSMVPIRRRSLLTPGIATRCSEGNILRKPPPPPESLRTTEDRAYYYNPGFPESSPLARLAALDLAQDGRSTPKNRSSTPCDLDYSHLCGFRPGTLRITNGAASPDPSVMLSSPLQRRLTPESDGYFTASEGSNNAGDDSELTSPLRPALGTFSSSGEGAVIEPSSVTGRTSFVPCGTGCHSGWNVSESAASSPDPASAIAQEYISELALRPGDDDSIFDLKAQSVSYQEIRRRDYLTDDGLASTSPAKTSNGTSSSLLTVEPAAMKRLIKTDSGYGSSFSLCLNTEAETASHYSQEQSSNTSNTVESVQSLRLETAYCPRPTRPAPEIPQGFPQQRRQIDSDGVDVSDIAPPSGKLDRPATVLVDACPQYNEEQASKGRLSPRKLQKPRRLSQPSLAEAHQMLTWAARELNPVEVPPIPPQIAERHAQRLDKFPALDHTFSSPDETKRSASLDTATRTVSSSIFSGLGAISSSAKAQTGPQSLSEAAIPPVPPPHRITISSPQSSAQQGTSPFDYFSDSVTQSIGRGPYDAARPRNAAENQTERSLRTRSMNGMDEETASRVGRERNMFRSSRIGTSINFSRPRPRSIHGSQFNDRGGIPGRMTRPKSWYDSAPPLPALPAPEATKDNRQSQIKQAPKHKSLPAPPNSPVLRSRPLPELPKTAVDAAEGTGMAAALRDWVVVEGAWRKRRQSVGEALGRNDQARNVLRQPDWANEQAVKAAEQALAGFSVGRFEGGFGYGFGPDKRAIWGSAGTAPKSSRLATRKSVDLSKTFGVDLSDVPVFVVA